MSDFPDDVPKHPDLDVTGLETGFQRHLRLDVVRFRQRLFSGGWSGERLYDVVRRGQAVAIVLYDPDRDAVVLIEQFRIAAVFAGLSPWMIEVVAGLVDKEGEPDADAYIARQRQRDPDLWVIEIETSAPDGVLDDGIIE